MQCGTSVAEVEPMSPAAVAVQNHARDRRPVAQASQPVPANPPEYEPQQSSASTPSFAKSLGEIAGAVLMGALYAASGSSGTKVYRGTSQFGDVILTVADQHVYEGSSTFGAPIFAIDGLQIRQGNSLFGSVLANLDGNLVRAGASTWGDVIACIDGQKIFKGNSSWGTQIAFVEGGRNMAGAAAAVYLLRY